MSPVPGTTRWTFLLPGILAGCAGVDKLSVGDSAVLPETVETDADVDTDTDTPTDPVCEARVAAILPADGAAAVPLGTGIDLSFTNVAVAVGVVLDPPVDGVTTLAADGRTARFQPDAPLARGTTYTVTATTCDVPAQAAFTTVGDPVATDLVLHTWDVDLGDGSDLTWVAPGLGPTLAAVLDTPHLLLMVEALDDGDLHFISALGTETLGAVSQYRCAVAIDVPPVPFTDDPGFSVGPYYAALALAGETLPVWDLVVSGEFLADGSALTHLVLAGRIDLAPLTVPLGQDPCDLAEVFGDVCSACPTGAETCVDLVVEDGRAELLPELVIDPYLTPDADCG